MKLVVKNVGTDVNPDFLVFTEAGELIECVTSVGLKADVDDFGVTRCEMAWVLYDRPASSPSLRRSPSAAAFTSIAAHSLLAEALNQRP